MTPGDYWSLAMAAILAATIVISVWVAARHLSASAASRQPPAASRQQSK
jgi:hypothetical protein